MDYWEKFFFNTSLYIYLLICLTIFSCEKANNEFNKYQIGKIYIYKNKFIDAGQITVLENDIKEKIIHAKRIRGPIKGIKIAIELTTNSDTTELWSYGGGKWFKFREDYYEVKGNLLPDSMFAYLRSN